MLGSTEARSAGRRPVPWPLRLLAALLVVAQLTPAVAAHGDAPPAPVSHPDHVGSPSEGCQPFHDEMHCLACRLISTQPVSAGASPLPVAWPQELAGTFSGDETTPATEYTPTLRARAPPAS